MRRKHIWQLQHQDKQKTKLLAEDLGVSSLLATILLNRGIKTVAEARSFLEASLIDLQSSYELPFMQEGVERIIFALKNEEQILIYGDYDVDGITATVLLLDLLRRLGGKVNFYIPDRLEEGYGLSVAALVKAKEAGTDLIISVDCGISSVDEAVWLKKEGIDLIITDHHQPPQCLPFAQAVINPKLADESKPWFDLAGVGVAFKVGQAVSSHFSKEYISLEYLDLVALGTIADIVNLYGENRILVKEGLNYINRNKCRPGLQGLINSVGLKDKNISTDQVGFVLAPRLNACGRLGKADLAVKLLLSTDVEEIDTICKDLDEDNNLRRKMQDDIYNEALQQIASQGGLGEEKLIFLASAHWHPGVIGIVASRLTEKYYCPTILLNLTEGIAKGSARSIPGFHLYQALQQVQEHLLNFGGHEMAAGLTLAEEMIPLVRQQLQEYAHAILDEKSLAPVLPLDVEVTLEEVNEHLLEDLNLLAPYGSGNPFPLLLIRNVFLEEVRKVGKEGKHLKLKIADKNVRIAGIGFQLGDWQEEVGGWLRCDLAFVPQLNTYQGITEVQMQIKDLKSSLEPDDPYRVMPFLEQLYLKEGHCLEDAAEPKSNYNFCVQEVKDDKSVNCSGQIKEKIKEAILGKGEYYEKQKEALQLLQEGYSTLLVLGTGRGKTAVFQAFSAYLTLLQKKVTIIVYPLRSLVNDQDYRFQKTMSLLGVRVSAVNGSLSKAERQKFFQDLQKGQVDIILTTPEFLIFHLDKFMQIKDKLGFFVVDEGHHVARIERRGYLLLGQSWEQLGKPLALVTTATATDEVARHIMDVFSCSRLVIENHIRENLQIVDKRKEKDKLKYLLKLLETEERIVIYVNSRQQAYQLASDLRFYYPRACKEIAFYHGGLFSQQRVVLEEMFRTGELRVMVTTSAFGEGIDIPDIKHLVLYHLCFSFAEFNQLSGRAGRNHEKAVIHLLFNQNDRKLNEIILAGAAPTREVLVKCYLYLREEGKKRNPFLYTKQKLEKALHKKGIKNFHEPMVSVCLGIFEDLGLLRLENEGEHRYIYLMPPPSEKMDLAGSLCYLEGRDEAAEFKAFAKFVLKEKKEVILALVNSPIVPSAINQK